jgi:hypothetical protein
VGRRDEPAPFGIAQPRQKKGADGVDIFHAADSPVVEIAAAGSVNGASTVEDPLEPDKDGRRHIAPGLANRELARRNDRVARG